MERARQCLVIQYSAYILSHGLPSRQFCEIFCHHYFTMPNLLFHTLTAGCFLVSIVFAECLCPFPNSSAELYGACASTMPDHLPAGGIGHQCTFQSHHHRAGQIEQQHSHTIALITGWMDGMDG